MNTENSVTKKKLLEEISSYKDSLPVFVQIGNGELLPIDNITLSADATGRDGKIVLESWTTADDENEPGIII